MMQSPSGDVYLDGSSSAGLCLDAMPLVAGIEGRIHSPALSDLVAAGTLLPWSPRSADSMMAPSPTIHDALSVNMGLDVAHSSDTLCDSSTPFPGLFSIEGDAASVSSSASEDLASYQTDHHHLHHHHHQQIIQPSMDPSPTPLINNLLTEDGGHTTTDEEEEEDDDNMIVFTSNSSLPSPVLTSINQDQTISSSKLDAARRGGSSSSVVFCPAVSKQTTTSASSSSASCISINAGDLTTMVAETPLRDTTPWRFESVVVNMHSNDALSRSPPQNINCSSLVTEDLKDKPEDNTDDTVAKFDLPDDNREEFDMSSSSSIRRSSRRNRQSGNTGEDASEDTKARALLNHSQNGKEELTTESGSDGSLPLISGSIVHHGRSSRRNLASLSLQSSEIKEDKSGEDTERQTNRKGDITETKNIELFSKEQKSVKAEDDKNNLGRGRRSAGRKRKSDEMSSVSGDVKRVKDELTAGEDDCSTVNFVSLVEPLAAVTRARHASSNSDCSSTGSGFMDQTQSSFLDSPLTTVVLGGKRRRCATTTTASAAGGGGGRGSRESSVSSRDDSPAPTIMVAAAVSSSPTPPPHDVTGAGVITRRSSNRDHAKKQRCSCCVGDSSSSTTSQSNIGTTTTSITTTTTTGSSSSTSSSFASSGRNNSNTTTTTTQHHTSGCSSGSGGTGTNTTNSCSPSVSRSSSTTTVSNTSNNPSATTPTTSTSTTTTTKQRAHVTPSPASLRRTSARTSKTK